MAVKRGRRAIAILVLALTGCQPQSLQIAPTAETVALDLWSTHAAAPLVRELAVGYQDTHPEIRFAVRLTVASNATLLNAITGSDDSDTPIFGVTHYLPPDSSLWAAPLGRDRLAVVVHPDNPVTGVNIPQLQAIFQGRSTDWADIGGEAGPITVVSREQGSGDRTAFEALAMGGRPITLNARLAASGDAVLAIVGQESGAIGYVSTGLLDSRVRPLTINGIPVGNGEGSYPFQTTILIVGTTEPQGDYRDFFAWAQSPAGQAIVARRYLPLSH